MNEKIKVYSPDLNCVYCHEDLGVGIPSVSCGCGATQHISCVDEFGNSNTCGSCTYVFNSSEAIQLGVEHFKKPESLDELVEETLPVIEGKESNDIGTHVRALSYMVKDAGVNAVKSTVVGVCSFVYSSVLFGLRIPKNLWRSWYGVHFTVVDKEILDNSDSYFYYSAGAMFVDASIGAYLLYSIASPDFAIFACGLGAILGASFGFLGSALQQYCINRPLAEKYGSYSEKISKSYKSYLKKVKEK